MTRPGHGRLRQGGPRVTVDHVLLRTLSLMAIAFITVLAAACGGGSDKDDSKPPEGLRLTAGTPPSVEDCGFEDAESLQADGSGGETLAAPSPGTYTYRSRGAETVPGEGPRDLPSSTRLTVTPPRRDGNLSCVGFIRRWSDRTTTYDVYVLRGEDVYVTALGLDTPNSVESARPRPAILALSGSGTTWKGGFGGDTEGSYNMEILRRGTLSIAGERVRAVQVSSTATYRGGTTGRRRTTAWLGVDRPLILSEDGEQTLQVGGGEEQLRYSTTLTALRPR